MERTYYAINKQTARAAKHLNSFCDYTAGSATEEYKRKVDRIRCSGKNKEGKASFSGESRKHGGPQQPEAGRIL